MTRKKSVSKDSSSRTEVLVDPKPSTGETKVVAPRGKRRRRPSMDSMYHVAGLSAQAEKFIKSAKAAQLARRDLSIRAAQEIHLFQVHLSRLREEFRQMGASMQHLAAQERDGVAAALDNFRQILDHLQDPLMVPEYDPAPVVELVEVLEAHVVPPPTWEAKALLGLLDVELPKIRPEFADPGMVASYEAAKLACLSPLVQAEARATRSHRRARNS